MSNSKLNSWQKFLQRNKGQGWSITHFAERYHTKPLKTSQISGSIPQPIATQYERLVQLLERIQRYVDSKTTTNTTTNNTITN